MKRMISILFSLIFFLLNPTRYFAQDSLSAPIKVIVTVYPAYDWVQNIIGDLSYHAQVSMLTDSPADMHNYQISFDDIIRISMCDLFIYVGGLSESWVDRVLDMKINPDMVIVKLMDVVSDRLKEEEFGKGMEDDTQDHDTLINMGDIEYDEHIWLSIRNAMICCQALTDALVTVDSINADTYRDNLSGYLDALSALDSRYDETVINGSCRVLLFGDRFPFRYLMDDYGLDYYAAFPGCSAESEASFGTIVFLSEILNTLNLGCILVTETADMKIAEMIRQNSNSRNQPIYTLNSMQSVSKEDIAQHITYLSIMESNLKMIKKAVQ